MILKSHALVPLGAINMIHNSLQRLKFLEADLSLSIDDLENTVRHRESDESTRLKRETDRLSKVKLMQEDLTELLDIVQAETLDLDKIRIRHRKNYE